MDLAAGLGVAMHELTMVSGQGFVDYMLFVDGRTVGVLETNPVGYALFSVELHADTYEIGFLTPKGVDRPVNPLPFLYVSTGVGTKFTYGLASVRQKTIRVYFTGC